MTSQKPERPLRLLLAARLSRKGKTDRGGMGIETQDEHTRDWAKREGHIIIATIADVKSGTTAPWHRKNLRPWVTDHELMAKYDGIVTWKVDRLSRGTQEDFTEIERWAASNGKILVIADGPRYPARDDSDYWSWAAMKRESRREWENIRERILVSRRRVVGTNKAFWGKVPFGYEPSGEKYFKTIIPTDEGRAIIPELYGRRASGESFASLARWLREVAPEAPPALDETEPRKRDWADSSVQRLVASTTYLGYHLMTMTDDEGVKRSFHIEVEPLTTQALHARANELPRKNRGPAHGEDYLSGNLYCARCGGTMYRLMAGPDRDRRPYFRCGGKPRTNPRRGCGAPLLPYDEAVEAAHETLAASPYPEVITDVQPGLTWDIQKSTTREEMASVASSSMRGPEKIAELTRLQAVLDELDSRPEIAAVAVRRTTGRMYGAVYAEKLELGTDAVRDWLKMISERDGLRLTGERQNGVVDISVVFSFTPVDIVTWEPDPPLEGGTDGERT